MQSRVLADVTLVKKQFLTVLVHLLLVEEMLSLLLFPQSLDYNLPLLGREILLETRLKHHVSPVLDHLLWTSVMLAGWLQRALRTPVVYEHVALQVDRSLLELVESLLLQLLPDLLLTQIRSLVNQISLLSVQDVEP